MTLILTPGTHPPIPSAIVQKEQLGLIEINRDPTPEELEAMMRGECGHTATRRLPYRLPEATFQRIRWYLHNPADLNNPIEGEAVNIPEADAFDEKLSNEQLQFVTAAIGLESIKTRAGMESDTAMVKSTGKAFTPPGTKTDSTETKIRKMAGEMTAGEIAEELKLALPVVMAALEGRNE